MRKLMFGLLGLVLSCLSACTGLEIGAKAGIYRVDERSESQKTHNIPLKCYLWADCSQASTQVQGS